MIVHWLLRLPDLVNMLGLMVGTVGLYFTSEKKTVKIIGIVALAIFMVAFLLTFYLFVRDFIALHPYYRESVLGLPY